MVKTGPFYLGSQDRFDPLAPDHIQQDQPRPFRALGAALQLGDVADRQLEMMREDGLGEAGLFADGPDFIGRQLCHLGLDVLPVWHMREAFRVWPSLS